MRYLILSWLILFVPLSYGQNQRDNKDKTTTGRKIPVIPPARTQLRWIIDKPTAQMLPRGAFDLDFRTFPQGGLQATLDIGLARRFSVGLAYGGAGILSENTPEWNSRVEILFRYQIMEGDYYSPYPSLAIGYSSFGYGLFVKKDSLAGYNEDRYLVKSPGFYVVLTKRYAVYDGDVGFHTGANYSLENELDSDPDAFIGMDVGLGYDMVYSAEYDFAINDNKRAGIFGIGRGYFNMGIAWFITPELSLELDFRNLLLNRKQLDGSSGVIDREIRLVYMQFFTD